MKNILKSIFTGLFIIALLSFLKAQPIDNPQKDLVLVISSESGNNGVAVTYSPKTKLYYTVFAGNAQYPLEIFTEEGKNVYSSSSGFDIRGMYYHAKWNCLVGNLYDDGGYFKIQLSASGMPTGQSEVYLKGLHQPSDQSGGQFNTKKNLMYCINDMQIYQYNMKDGSLKSQIPITGFSDRGYESCVTGSILYSGEKGYEFILVDNVNNKLYFFNAKGVYVKMMYFSPEEYIHDYFNMSYCNKRLWTYNKDSRQWTAYKLFN
ncbi:MAG: hypothetical protein CVU11_05580 [Bacteroidetes bacterium HGW-Bacteroidetes-6]|jgi:hypothetical protein|nr:MAG: hypothetical protein CVU11_05580 [Bacteroidetes bacterium HGW-Bacteroidetes-6]